MVRQYCKNLVEISSLAFSFPLPLYPIGHPYYQPESLDMSGIYSVLSIISARPLSESDLPLTHTYTINLSPRLQSDALLYVLAKPVVKSQWLTTQVICFSHSRPGGWLSSGQSTSHPGTSDTWVYYLTTDTEARSKDERRKHIQSLH